MTNILSNRFVQTATATLILFAVTAPASALERFRSDTQPCASVQQMLNNAGTAVIQYPSQKIDNYLLYDRYVSSSAYCEPGEETVPATVAAADNLTCEVLTCAGKDSDPKNNRRATVRLR